MQNVVVLAAGNERGGAASHLVTLAKAALQESSGVSYHFVCVGDGPLLTRLQEVTNCVELPASLGPAVRALRNLLRSVHRPIVHAHGPRLNLIAYLTCRSNAVPWTSTVHSNPYMDFLASRWKTLLLTRLNVFCLRHAVGLFVVNPHFSKYVPNATVVFVPNAINLKRLPEPKAVYEAALRERLHVPDDAFVVGVAARLDPVKNLSTLITAISLVANERVHLAIAGDGAEWEKLHALAEALQITDRVHFLGYIDWVQTFYAGLQVHVLSSRSEGLPFSILEAGHSGVPNIGTDIPSLTYLLQNGVTGLCTPVDDADALAQALMRVQGDATFARALVTSFQEQVLPKYALEKMVAAYERGYSLFLGPKSPREIVEFSQQ